MKYRGIIFDLDGVLCSTDQYHYQAWKRVADALPVDFDEQINQKLRGVSRVESLEIILKNYTGVPLTAEKKRGILEEKNQIYRHYIANISEEELLEGVKETLKELQKAGCVMAVGSSSKNAGIILSKLGIEGVFHAVIDGTKIIHSKPDPEVFQKTLEALHLSAGECIVVEDALSGVEAGHGAGMRVACVGQAARENRGDYNLEKLSDILKIVI